MKLRHPDSPHVVESNNPEAYLSQGWVDADEAPKANSSLKVWQDYARSQGVSDAELEGVSRDDLRARFTASAE